MERIAHPEPPAPRRRRLSLRSILCIISAALLGGCGGEATGPTAEEVDRAIALGTDHLITMIRPDGRFIYRANLDRSVEVRDRYNLVRHAGTIFALAEALQREPNAEHLAKLRRAAGFLRLQIYPIPEAGTDVMALVSDPRLTRSGPVAKAKLGGSALALAGLLRLEAIAPGTTPDLELQGLARFILFMQEPDGGFHDHYLPDLETHYSPIDSLYYPGEAALGLAMLHARDGADRWLTGARDALLHLGRTRADWPLEEIPADHWALLATAAVLPQTPDPQQRAILLDHARRVTRSILASQITAGDDPAVVGAFDEHGHTTPTATRMEGLLAALTFLPEEDSNLRDDVLQAVRQGMSFLVTAQVKDGDWAGAMPRTHAPSDVVGDRATEIRIDYTQHFLSALMQYEQVVLGKRPESTE